MKLGIEENVKFKNTKGSRISWMESKVKEKEKNGNWGVDLCQELNRPWG